MHKSLALCFALAAASPAAAYAKDYAVTGSHLEIAAEENVDDLSVAGGTADVRAVVHGDVSVLGGGVQLRAPVEGDVSVMAGQVDIYSDVKGDVDIVMGKVNLHDGAKILGKMRHMPGMSHADHDDASVREEAPEPAHPVRSALYYAVVFAIFGGLFRWLMPHSSARMLDMQQRPAVSMFLSGIMTSLLGTLLLLGLTVTLVGIPLMLLLVFAALVAVPALVAHYSYGYLDRMLKLAPRWEPALRVGNVLLLGAITQVPHGGLMLSLFSMLALGAAWHTWTSRKSQPEAPTSSTMSIST